MTSDTLRMNRDGKIKYLYPVWEVILIPFDGAIKSSQDTFIVIAPNFTIAAQVALEANFDLGTDRDFPWDTQQAPVVVSVKMILEYVYGAQDFIVEPERGT